MEVGDAIRITTEWGKYYYKDKDISGMIGLITCVGLDLGEDSVALLLSNGVEVTSLNSAWLEVLG